MNNKTIFFNVIVVLIANFCSGMEDLRLHPANKIIRQLPVGAIYLCKNQIFMCNQSDRSAWIENLKTNDKVKIDGLDKFVYYEVNPKREKMVFWDIQKVVLYDVIRKEKCILDLPMDCFEMIEAVCFSGEDNLVIRTKDRFTIYNYKHSISSIQEHNNIWGVFVHLTEPFIYCLSRSRKLSAYRYKQMINSFEIQYLFDKDLQGDTFSPSLIEKGFLATSKKDVVSVIKSLSENSSHLKKPIRTS